MSEPESKAEGNVKDGYLVVNNLYADPYQNIVAAMVYNAVLEARLKYEYCYHKKKAVRVKKDALEFIFSWEFEYWVELAKINISPETIRQSLRKELSKYPEMKEILTDPKYNSPNRLARIRKNDKICLNLSGTDPEKTSDMGVSG